MVLHVTHHSGSVEKSVGKVRYRVPIPSDGAWRVPLAYARLTSRQLSIFCTSDVQFADPGVAISIKQLD